MLFPRGKTIFTITLSSAARTVVLQLFTGFPQFTFIVILREVRERISAPRREDFGSSSGNLDSRRPYNCQSRYSILKTTFLSHRNQTSRLTPWRRLWVWPRRCQPEKLLNLETLNRRNSKARKFLVFLYTFNQCCPTVGVCFFLILGLPLKFPANYVCHFIACLNASRFLLGNIPYKECNCKKNMCSVVCFPSCPAWAQAGLPQWSFPSCPAWKAHDEMKTLNAKCFNGKYYLGLRWLLRSRNKLCSASIMFWISCFRLES